LGAWNRLDDGPDGVTFGWPVRLRPWGIEWLRLPLPVLYFRKNLDFRRVEREKFISGWFVQPLV
jgi:hypothetical protein